MRKETRYYKDTDGKIKSKDITHYDDGSYSETYYYTFPDGTKGCATRSVQSTSYWFNLDRA